MLNWFLPGISWAYMYLLELYTSFCPASVRGYVIQIVSMCPVQVPGI